MGSKGQILAALDTVNIDEAVNWAHRLTDRGRRQTGAGVLLANGLLGYRRIAAVGMPIFLDLKLHDIPNTVAGALRAITPLSPSIVTVHAAGGQAMMEAARETAEEQADKRGVKRPKIIGVTVLTSLDDKDLAAGQMGSTSDQVKRLATLAKSAGLDGVVARRTRSKPARELGDDFLLVVPGARPAGSDSGDQKRVRTPGDAAKAEADYLVIGRPITGAKDPRDAACRIATEIDAAIGHAPVQARR